MLINQRVTITRIFAGTWRHLFFDFFVCLLAFLGNEYFLLRYFELPVIVPTVLGTALSFFIGFINNQAYDRWWEARKIWGALVNDSRTWSRQILHYTSPTANIDDRELDARRRQMIRRHLGFVYALKAKLRGTNDKIYKTFISQADAEEIEKQSNLSNAILAIQSREIAGFNKQGVIDGFQLLAINDTIVKFCDEMGQSERIKNTIFPTTYSYYSRSFIWIFIVCLTIVTADAVHLWSILLGTLVGYIFLTIHTIGQALINPFDIIPTGIPLDQISRTIEIDLLESIGEQGIPEPIRNLHKDVVM